MKLWKVSSREELGAFSMDKWSWVTKLAFSPDGRTLALGIASDGRQQAEVLRGSGNVQLWDVSRRNVAFLLPQNGKVVHALAFSPEGKTLAVADENHTIQLWDVATGKPQKKLNLGNDTARGLACAPDSRSLAAALNNGLQIWSDPLKDDKPRHVREDNCVQVAYAPDGKSLAFSNGGRLWLLDPTSGRVSGQWDPAPRHSLTDLAFAGDGRHLAVAFDNATIVIIRLAAH
jgi:WD40 repeat protein